jgi:hypothetical protein
MRKLLLLALACIVWIGSGPRSACAACGQDKSSKDVIARPTYAALLQGILEELPLMRCPRPAGWMLHADGQQFYVDFGTNAELLAKAKKLQKTLVEIGGTLEDTGHYEEVPRFKDRPWLTIAPVRARVRILHVTSLTALADPESTPVEISGELGYVVLESSPPIVHWTLKADKKTYNLRFNSTALLDEAMKHSFGHVTVIGKLGKGDTITVTGLVRQDRILIMDLPKFPEEIPPFIFKPAIQK